MTTDGKDDWSDERRGQRYECWDGLVCGQEDRQHGYQTVGVTHPSQDTIIVVRNEDTVTHGFASRLFRDIDVQVENGKEVKGKNFRSFHVEPGHIMTLHFSTAPTKLSRNVEAESVRWAIWCDIHPEVRGELYIVETRGDLGGD